MVSSWPASNFIDWRNDEHIYRPDRFDLLPDLRHHQRWWGPVVLLEPGWFSTDAALNWRSAAYDSVVNSPRDLIDWPQPDFYRDAESAAPQVGHLHEYLVRCRFPQAEQAESITQAWRLLREYLIDKVLKRDMTVLSGVRCVLDLEHTLLYLCLHAGGLLDMIDNCANLEFKLLEDSPCRKN